MKKKLLLILPIIVLMIFIVITVIDKKESKIDFNTDIKLSMNDNKLNNTIKSFANTEYQIEQIDAKELTIEEENQVIETATNITNAFNQIDDDKYISNIEKYAVREPSVKLEEELVFTEEFKEWSKNLLQLETLAQLLRNRSATFETIKGTKITYSSSKRVLIQVYVDNYRITYGQTQYGLDAIFEYEIVYEEVSQKYKVNKMEVEWVVDLEAYYQNVETKERNQNKLNSNALSNVSTYIPESYTNFDYTKLKAVSQTQTTAIYEKNKDSVVIIDSASEGGLPTGSASGFYIREGIIMTSYTSIYSMIENGAKRYYAVNNEEKIIEIEGIVTVFPEINVAILKLKDETGLPITIGNSNTLEDNDPIVVISSSLGLKSSIKLGIYFDSLEDDYKIIRTSLPLIDGDNGSAIFNLNGEVIAINTSVSTSDSEYNSGLNNAVDINIVKDVINKLQKDNFKDIKVYSFDKLTQEETKKVINEVEENIWNNYQKLPLITNIYPVDLYSAYTNDKYLIIRYRQDNYNILTNEEVINLYIKNLTANEYRRVSDNVYTKNNITIRIQNNLGYIILIIEGVI